jgi:hypothetical protein
MNGKITDAVSVPLCGFPVKAFFTRTAFFLAFDGVAPISARVDRPKTR